MSGVLRDTGGTATKVTTVSFAERYATSPAFAALYRDGMTLVEETAAYLDGAGRREAKGLKGTMTLAYATESMRLTTRLMQLASWLLIRKAVNDGEMSSEDAVEERRKVRFSTIGRPAHVKDFEQLPHQLRSLVERSYGLHDKIQRLDQVINGEPTRAQTAQPVEALNQQRERLQTAYNVHDMAKYRGRQ